MAASRRTAPPTEVELAATRSYSTPDYPKNDDEGALRSSNSLVMIKQFSQVVYYH